MRALIAPGPGRLVMDEVPDPAPRPGQVLIRTRVTAVSAGTELRMLYRGQDEGAAGPGWPAVGAFGYLAAGDVLEVGAGVTDLSAGDRVTCGTGWGAHRELPVADAASVHVLPPGLSYHGSPAEVTAGVERASPDRPAMVIQAAGAPDALDLALRIVRGQGVVVNVGTLPTLDGFDLFWPMQWSGARLVPIHRPAGAQEPGPGLGQSLRRAYLPAVLDMIRRGRLDLRRLCSWVLPADDAPRAMAFCREHQEKCLGLAFAWDRGEVARPDGFEAAVRETFQSGQPGQAAVQPPKEGWSE